MRRIVSASAVAFGPGTSGVYFGIVQNPIFTSRACRDLGQLRCTGPQDVEDKFAVGQQIVGDNPAMATPPHCFCAHDGGRPGMAERPQLRQTVLKRGGGRIIRIVAETLIVPKRVGRRMGAEGGPTQAAELGNVVIGYARLEQRLFDRVQIKLGVGARSRHLTHIGYSCDARRFQQSEKFRHRTVRMTDGVEWEIHFERGRDDFFKAESLAMKLSPARRAKQIGELTSTALALTGFLSERGACFRPRTDARIRA
jgi:hypothetical protein